MCFQFLRVLLHFEKKEQTLNICFIFLSPSKSCLKTTQKCSCPCRWMLDNCWVLPVAVTFETVNCNKLRQETSWGSHHLCHFSSRFFRPIIWLLQQLLIVLWLLLVTLTRQAGWPCLNCRFGVYYNTWWPKGMLLLRFTAWNTSSLCCKHHL